LKKLKKLLLAKSVSANVDAGLLALRLIAPTSIWLKHGYEKLFDFPGVYEKMAAHHTYVMALGITPSLLCAAFADGILTVLMIIGLGTRWAAFFSLINLAVAWVVVNHMAYFSGPAAGHGEMIVAYIATVVALMLAGGGKYSIDHLLDR
jgi:putative oxidoreductase